MLHQDDLILNAKFWFRNEFAVPGGDMVLSAFVGLRIITAEMLQLATPSKAALSGPRGEMLSMILNDSITTVSMPFLCNSS